jgi:APA family basic amino acid/polyamine antiporter
MSGRWVLGQVFGNYVGMVFAVPPGWFAPVLITLVFALNYVGVEMAARAQTVLMLALLAVLAVFVVTGVPHYSPALVGNPLDGVPFPALAAVPLLISLFLGIESAVEIGEEVRNPQRTIPLGILLAIVLTALVYGAVALVALGLVGPEVLAAAKAPLLEAARVAMGEGAVPLIVGAAAISITKTMNSTALVFSPFALPWRAAAACRVRWPRSIRASAVRTAPCCCAMALRWRGCSCHPAWCSCCWR